MIEGLEIDETRLAAWLCANVEDFEGLRDVAKFSTGQSNPTYRIDADSGVYVLRAKPPGVLLKSAHMVEREYQVMAALAGSSVPVPGVYCLCDADASPFGRAFFVMGYLEGRIFWDPALPGMSVFERGQIYDAMNATLAALHSVDVDDVGLQDYGKPGNYFARQVGRWAGQYRAAVAEPVREMEQIIGWLGDNMPADDGQASLVHGDYRLDNMVFHASEPLVIGLLDWELSTLGHPLADLAYQCSQWRMAHNGVLRGLGGLDRARLGLPSEAAYVADYCQRRGIKAIENWRFYVVFSLFRFAAILQGVVMRARSGNASNPNIARSYGPAIPALVAMAIAEIG